MEPIKIIKYEGEYKDKLIKFNKTENNKDEKDFSDYILLTLEDNILAQLSITQCNDFYRFLDLKILNGFKLDYKIDEFIKYAIKQTNKNVYAFVVDREKELVDIYKRNGFELADHSFNKMKRKPGYVLKLNN